MRIAIDLQSFQGASRIGGIGRYSRDLVFEILRESSEHDFFILLNANLSNISQIRYLFSGLIPQSQIIEIDLPRGVAGMNGPSISRLSAEIMRELVIQRLNPDVLLLTSLVEGYSDDVVTSIGSLGNDVPTAAIIYDLIPLFEPDLYLQDPTVRAHYHEKVEQFKGARLLLSISDFSATEASDVWRGDCPPIVTISGGIDKKFSPQPTANEDSKKVLLSLGIEGDFILQAGSFDVRKNQTGLVKAFSKLAPSVREHVSLVFAGAVSDSNRLALLDLALKNGVRKSQVRFLGYVPDDQLVALYRTCSVFVLPSFREGLGLTVVEAMACGAPVVASNRTSLPEVVNNQEALFDPDDIDQMAQLMTRILVDMKFRQRLIRLGFRNAKRFDWQSVARQALRSLSEATYSEQLKNNSQSLSSNCTDLLLKSDKGRDLVKRLSIDEINVLARCLDRNETRAEALEGKALFEKPVGIVTTWNTRCGIASYSRGLSREFESSIVVLAPANQDLLGEDESFVHRCWRLGDEDLQGVFEKVMELGLQHVIIQFSLGFYQPKPLVDVIRRLRSAGVSSSMVLHSTTDPPPTTSSRKLADYESALTDCSKVFYHSPIDEQRVKGLAPTANTTFLPHFAEELHAGLAPTRKRAGSRMALASFGFLLPGKGIEELVEGARIMTDAGLSFSLSLFNSIYPVPESSRLEEKVRQLIRNYGLGHHVHLDTRYKTEDDLMRALGGADLVVLPYQTSSESSSAAVRFALSSGAPVAVTPISLFDNVRDLVLTLPGIGPLDIARGIHDSSGLSGEILEGRERRLLRWASANSAKKVAGFLAQEVALS